MFQDEACFGRISDARRCWAPGGFRPVVGRQVVREYTYAFAAVSPHDGRMDSLILPLENAATMSLFLDEVGRRHSDEDILMVLDQAGWHVAKGLELPPNIKLLLLPAHSPELNPAEHLWREIRQKWFANLVFDSMEAVEDRLCQALRHLENNPRYTQSIVGFDWIVNVPLIAT
jgi:transposase